MPMKRRPAPAKAIMVPAPVKGWSSLDSIADAEEGTALAIENWYPESDSIRVRKGCTSWATGIGGSVDSLLPYTGQGGTYKLFAAKSSAVYDVTSGGAVGAAAFSGMSNGDWISEMFTSAAGTQYMVICNGANGVRTFDGTTWVDQTASITGTTGAVNSFSHVCAHKGRLWFVQDNSTNLWYLGSGAINGAATKFPLGSLLKLGGKITACATWSSSEGFALDDMLAIITNQGEVLVYAGTDPSSANTWALKLRFVLAPPLSKRCFMAVGAELMVLTEAGLLPVSQVIEIDPATLDDKAVTRRIRRSFTDAVTKARGTAGWTMVTLPSENLGLIQVPAVGDQINQQFVLNTMTGAWARFYGWSAVSWAYLNGTIYYGDASGNVFKAMNGANDNGSPIQALVIPAFSDLGAKGRIKKINLVQPVIYGDVQPAVNIGVAVDYKAPTLSVVASSVTSGWFTWDSSVWDGPDVWKGVDFSQAWDGVGNIGRTISSAIALNFDAGSIGSNFTYRLISTEYLYEAGAVV